MGYRVVKKSWQEVQPFWYRASVWQTDRQTDRQTNVQPISIICKNWKLIAAFIISHTVCAGRCEKLFSDAYAFCKRAAAVHWREAIEFLIKRSIYSLFAPSAPSDVHATVSAIDIVTSSLICHGTAPGRAYVITFDLPLRHYSTPRVFMRSTSCP